jgi:hypothetical protein
MSTKSLIITLLAGLVAAEVAPAAAQTTVMPVYLAMDPQQLVASVVTANPTLTSYTFTCAPGYEDTCNFAGRGGNLTVMDQSTYIMSVNGAIAGTPLNDLNVACTSFNAQSVVCAETQNSVLLASGGAESLSTMSVLFTQDNADMQQLTVTAGLDQLAAAATEAASLSMAATMTTATAGGVVSTTTGAASTASATGANWGSKTQASVWSVVGVSLMSVMFWN